MSSSDSEDGTPVKQRKHYKQKYSKSWEAKFSWLTASSLDHVHFRCKSCQQDYLGGMTEIKRHEKTLKHISGTAVICNQPTVKAYVSNNTLENKIKSGELRIAAFIAEHNVRFTVADHMVELIKAICSDSEIAKGLQCGRTKAIGLVKNVLGAISQEHLWEQLRSKPFSLMIDESTDKGCIKHLALVVRLKTNNRTRDEFLDILPMGTDCTGANIFSMMKKLFDDKKVPFGNIVGFSADGANVMMGEHSRVVSFFKRTTPDIFTFKCSCHSFALCASYACRTLPLGVETLIREIYKYFKYSNKRIGSYAEFQHFCEVKPHKMLHPSQTRWLSLHSCVQRTLEQWKALKMFFHLEVIENKDELNELINSKLNNTFNKMYLQFLDHILPYINDLNKEMQSENPKIHTLYVRVEVAYKSILQMFIKKQYLDKQFKIGLELETVKYRNPANIMPLEEVYFGGSVLATLLEHKDIPSAELTKFRTTCLSFYQELLTQIDKRFSFKDQTVLKHSSALIPSNIVSKHNVVPSLVPLALCFPSLVSAADYNSLDREWRLLGNTELDVDPEIVKKDFEGFWIEVKNLTNSLDEPVFPLLVKLVEHVSILPHSSASVERVFSSINANKTKMRNRLGTDTLVGLLHTKRILNEETAKGKETCYSFKITSKMTQKMITKEVYDFKK